MENNSVELSGNTVDLSGVRVDLSGCVDVSQVDSVVRTIIQKFLQRASVGKLKYGTDLDRNDLSTRDWINHAQEELMDAILYLQKLKGVLSFSKFFLISS